MMIALQNFKVKHIVVTVSQNEMNGTCSSADPPGAGSHQLRGMQSSSEHVQVAASTPFNRFAAICPARGVPSEGLDQ